MHRALSAAMRFHFCTNPSLPTPSQHAFAGIRAGLRGCGRAPSGWSTGSVAVLDGDAEGAVLPVQAEQLPALSPARLHPDTLHHIPTTDKCSRCG
mmetsp:Transcript_13598/g.31976  ORF Transcript_13598/g.31976 Transcript_13598/m.31976 type:complete len:95 (+) Transcript_13598:4083-4367(+)